MSADDWRLLAWLALAWGVMCTVLLIVALGSIDAMREQLGKEKAMRRVREIRDRHTPNDQESK